MLPPERAKHRQPHWVPQRASAARAARLFLASTAVRAKLVRAFHPGCELTDTLYRLIQLSNHGNAILYNRHVACAVHGPNSQHGSSQHSGPHSSRTTVGTTTLRDRCMLWPKLWFVSHSPRSYAAGQSPRPRPVHIKAGPHNHPEPSGALHLPQQ